jgi:DNA-binding transcriptional MocR family regulator
MLLWWGMPATDPMTDLNHATAEQLRSVHDTSRRRYDEFVTRGVKLDLTRGKPASEQLDLAGALLTLPGTADFLAADGSDTRNYGVLQGLPELRELMAPLFGLQPQHTIIADNSSLGLMHDSIAYALLCGTIDSPRPWSKNARVSFLCPVPGYDRHFAICQDFGIEMIPVPMTETGPDLDVVERLVKNDDSIRGMWCMPKYSNPTGTVYSDETVERLAAMTAAAPDFRLFWDNAYAVHHLTADRIEIANIVTACERHGHPNRPFVYGSTSKITLAGAGVALFGSSANNVAWYLKRMGRRTIGGDKVNQLRHVRFLRDRDGLLALMDAHRAVIAPKFASVISTLDRHLTGCGVARWTQPKGGYFVSLDVLDGCASEVVQLARQAGVELTPAGSTFPHGKDPDNRNIRIAPTYPDRASVGQAAEGVALSVLVATTSALIARR